MIRINSPVQSILLAVITIALMAPSGCNSKGKNEPNESQQESGQKSEPNKPDKEVPKTSPDTSPKADDKQISNDSGVIKGDLSSVDWAAMLGQEVTIQGDLVVVDNYDLARRGQVRVSRDRLYIPTNSIDPNDADPNETSFEGGSNVASVTKAQKSNDRATLILDDGSDKQNVFPPVLFPELGKSQPTVRIGSTIKGVTGKLIRERNNIVLAVSGPVKWTPAKRPKRPEVGKNADVVVASFNVLNYYSTIDDGNNQARGADSKSEFKRQEAKIVSAILGLNADVIGLMEIENNLQAEKQLLAALNSAAGSDIYKGCGMPGGFSNVPGGRNAIRVGIIYRSDRVDPVGDVESIENSAFELARAPIVQEFKSKTSEKPFTVVVNHFKSKGGSDRADSANKNKGDGQGAYNAARRNQSLAICKYVEGLDSGSRVLVIGDLNAYGQEDPIDAFRAKGYVDLHEKFGGDASEARHYSYIYFGQCGSLDHALATKALANDVTGIATWHINSDEPRFLDYNEEYNPKVLYKADPFRSSDHDPVLIGIGK